MLSVRAGSLFIYRFYDVANEIDLNRAQAIIARSYPAYRLRLQRLRPRVVRFANPPLTLPLRPYRIEVSDWPLPVAEIIVRLYAFGAVAVRLECPLPEGTTMAEVEHLTRSFLDIDADPVCRPLVLDTLREVAPALYKPQWDWEEWLDEDYLVVYVRRFEGDAPLGAPLLLREYDFARLLMGEEIPLSDQVREAIMRYAYTYTPEDLAVLSWEAAFVYDTDGIMDVPDLLEFANAQLLELEFFDEYLDEELEKAYDDVEAVQRGGGFWRYAHMRRVLNRLTMTVMEVTELSGRVINALKITEDVFYAQVYTGASEVLGLPTWIAGVQEKLHALRDIYAMLAEEATNTRLMLLETAIVLLILFEIVLAVLGIW